MSFLLPENKFKPRTPFCSNTDVRDVAGSRFEPECAFDTYHARIYLSREVSEVLFVRLFAGLFGFFNNPNTAVPSALSPSPNLWQDCSSVY